MRRSGGAAAIAAFLLAQAWVSAAAAGRPPELGDDLVALSLSALQDGLEAGTIDPELPLPITRILGAFLDREGRDIVLLGRREPAGEGAVPILPDDIALAMRSIWLSDQIPGMSIDPMGTGASDLMPGSFQRVVYFGRLEGTRAGLYAFRCDYWLKRLAAGAIPAPIPNFERYADLIGGPGSPSSQGNRFWFHPETPEIELTPAGDLMLFEHTGVELLTERDRSQFAGVRTHYLYLGRDPVAERFARAFNRRFAELASANPDLVRLRNFFALAQVFGWIEHAGLDVGRNRIESWNYLLRRYVPVPAHCPARVPTVVVELTRGPVRQQLAGGVSVEIRLPPEPAIDGTGTLARLASRLARSAPRRGAFFWNVETPRLEDPVLGRLRRELAAGRPVGWLRRHARELGDVLGIEPIGDGGLAVLRRTPDGLELASVDGGGTTVLERGDRAGERFDEIARETCRSASDADLVFVHVRQRRGSMIFQVGGVRQRFSLAEVSAFLDHPGSGSPVERLFLAAGEDFGLYRDGLAVARRDEPPGSPPPLDDPARWAVALDRHFAGRLRFHVTDDPARARRNLPKAASPVHPSDLAVLLRPGPGGELPVSDGVPGALAAHGIRVARTLGEIPDASHLLFVSGGTREEILDDLEALGRRGRMRGRLVVLYAPHGALGLDEADELIERYAMAGMVHHLHDVEPALLADALLEIRGVLRNAAAKEAPVTGDRLLGDALELAAQETSAGSLWNREVAELQETILQI